jgi:hypothetical protein
VIDTVRALRTPSELVTLVRAVVAALPEDELDWIEWKCVGDLSDKATQGTIARHILGMANRRPEKAMLRAQGCAYLVIGAEPGSLPGITPIDPSQLDQGVQPYLGPDGPAWSPQYVQEADVTVLVITVERAELGHRIFTLEREFTRSDGKIYLAGTVFVRRPGRTIQAEPGDIRGLEQRLTAPAREAEEHARRMLQIEEARLAAEEREHTRRWLTEMSKLISAILFKAGTHPNDSARFRCEEQIQLQTMIAGADRQAMEADMPAVVAAAGAGQFSEAFAAAARANVEIQAAMVRLANEGLTFP